ncbi:Deleted in lung and esophageal cancer protein 1, partial [Podochytrium sp. JEL0797]
MASTDKKAPPLLPTLVPTIFEPAADPFDNRNLSVRDLHLKHADSTPALSTKGSPKKRDEIQKPVYSSAVDLREIKHKEIASLREDAAARKPEWLKSEPLVKPKGKLPLGASIMFKTEQTNLEQELQDAKSYLETWGCVQAKALESLVCANKDLKSYKPPKPLSQEKPASGTDKKSPPKSASKSLKATPTKNGKSSSNLAKRPSSSTAGPVGKDPRTGIVIGEGNVAILNAKAAASDPNSASSKERPAPENWPEILWNTGVKLTPMDISETLYRLAGDADALAQFRDSAVNKSDWVAKIIKERANIITRIQTLEMRLAVATKDMSWVMGHRDYGRSKSLMVSTVFSDYAQDNALRLPSLGAPELEVSISDSELLRMGAPTAGIFNQVRNIMITRTDNGLQNIWVMKKNISDNFEVPGVLEAEAMDQAGRYPKDILPSGALEPRKVIHHKPQNSMHPFEDKDVELLKKMRSRINYLRNPRFPQTTTANCIGILRDDVMPTAAEHKSSPEEIAAKSLRSIGGGIVATPPNISFTDYQPFQKYSQILTIKNRSPYSARFRLSTPPPFEYSPFFSVTLISTPASGDGLIAPGMGCQYRVEFTPSSLANFEQVLFVYTELGVHVPGGFTFEPFSVILSGTRAAPELTMPDVLHCGPCRDGYVANDGLENEPEEIANLFMSIGSYKTEAEYQAAIADKSNESAHSTSLSQDSFVISPSYFTLASGESEEITVLYKAEPIPETEESPTTRKVETILRIACDNCQVLELPLRANIQKPMVSISECIPTSMQELQQGSWDVEGVKFLFGNQNLLATTRLTLTIRNQSRLRLPFTWVPIENPGFKPDRRKNESAELGSFGSVTLSDSFSFFPTQGVFAPNGEVQFQVEFTPTRAKKYDVIGRLLLLEEGDRTQSDEFGAANSLDLECVLEIFCNGVGLEYSVQAKPEILLVPASIYTGTCKESEVRIVNNSISPVSCEWTTEGIDADILNLTISETDALAVEPAADLKFKVRMTGVFPGVVNGHLICKTAGNVGPTIRVPIQTTVDVKPGDLEFGVPFVDFGLLALGTSATSTLPLSNNSKLPFCYRLTAYDSDSLHSQGSSDVIPDSWHLEISNSEGILLPGESTTIQLTFIPLWYQSFRGVLSCEIVSQATESSSIQKSSIITALDMCAEVQTPSAVINHPENSVVCYVNEPFNWNFSMTNKTQLETKFEWKPHPQESLEVKYSPLSGVLNPGETMDMCITLKYTEIGENQKSEFECAVEGMVESNGVLKAKMVVDVHGLYVHMKFPPPYQCRSIGYVDEREVAATPARMLDFGNDCPIFESRTLFFVIHNRSAIASPYRLWMETFTAMGIGKPVFDEEQVATHEGIDASKLILKPTEKNKIGFSSAIGKQWLDNMTTVRKTIAKMNQVLQEGRGAAFHPTPSHGILPPFGKLTIAVTSYSNLVGSYKDTLVCEIGAWLREKIPVQMGVDGVPVKFSGAQLVVSKSNSKIDRVNFGTQISQLGKRISLPHFGTDYYPSRRPIGRHSIVSKIQPLAQEELSALLATLSKKEIQVENQSPRTICLRWNVFIQRKSLSSVVAQQSSGTTPSVTDIDALLLDELINNDPLTAAVVVQPSPMYIPAFKTASARISFCAKETGYYKAVLVADVGYVQADGTITYSPSGDENASSSFANGGSFESNLMAPLKQLEERNASFPDGLALPRIRKVRLLVQAKVIEPNLSLDDTNEEDSSEKLKAEAIWFKRVRENEVIEAEIERKRILDEMEEKRIHREMEDAERARQKILVQHKNTASVFIHTDISALAVNNALFTTVKPDPLVLDSLSVINSGDAPGLISGQDEPPIVEVLLKNNSDAACSFRVTVSSSDIFRLVRVEKPQTPATRKPQEITLPTNQISSVAVTPIIPPTASSSIRVTRDSAMSRFSRASGRMPFTAPTNSSKPTTANLSKASTLSSKPSSKRGSIPAIGEEEDEITDEMVFSLNPMETIRVALECLDLDMLRTTTSEDNASTNPSYVHSPNSEMGQSLGASSLTCAKKSMAVFEQEDHSRDFVKGHLKLLFSNGTLSALFRQRALKREIADLLEKVAYQKEAIDLLQILTGKFYAETEFSLPRPKLPFKLGSTAVTQANVDNAKLAIAYNDQVIHKLLVDRAITMQRKVRELIEIVELSAAAAKPPVLKPADSAVSIEPTRPTDPSKPDSSDVASFVWGEDEPRPEYPESEWTGVCEASPVDPYDFESRRQVDGIKFRDEPLTKKQKRQI